MAGAGARHGAHRRARAVHTALAGVPREFWNIGVRIEDDVLVTAGDPEVMSGALEKDPDALEAWSGWA